MYGVLAHGVSRFRQDLPLGGADDPHRYSDPTMKMLRRAILALSAAATVAGVLRLRGKGGVPPQTGGWRELSTRPR
jgi:hypothetical protein